MHNSLKLRTLRGGVVLFCIFLCFLYSCSKEEIRERNSESINTEQRSGESEDAASGDGSHSYIHNPADYADVSGLDPDKYLTGIESEFSFYDGKTTITVPKNASSGLPLSCYWNDGDEVKIFCKNQSGNWLSSIYKYNSETGKLAPASTDLHPGNQVLPAGSIYYAYYPTCLPAGEHPDGSGNMTVDIAAVSKFVGKSTDGRTVTITNAPMASRFIGKSATFHNLGSIVVVQDYGLEKVKSVTISASEDITSSAGTVSFDGSGNASMALGSSNQKEITIDLGGYANAVQLDETNPANFSFILPPIQSLSGMKVKVTYSQMDGTGQVFTPYVTKSLSLESADLSSIRRAEFRHHYFSGGTGTSADPYQIKTKSDFLQLMNLCNDSLSDTESNASDGSGYNSALTDRRSYFTSDVHYEQSRAITFSGSDVVTPLGDDTEHKLYFNYTGAETGITLKALSISSGKKYVGLFSYLTTLTGSPASGHIERVILESSTVESTNTSSDSSTGGVLGCLAGGAVLKGVQFRGESDSSTGQVSGLNVGGVVGYVADGTVQKSDLYDGTLTRVYYAEVTANEGSSYSGGIVGKMDKGEISNCYFGANISNQWASLSGATNVGGICGILGNGTDKAELSETYSSAITVEATGDNVGGVVGICNAGSEIYARKQNSEGGAQASLSITFGSSSISSAGSYVGGIVGRIYGSLFGNDGWDNAGTVRCNTVYGKDTSSERPGVVTVKGKTYVGGIAGGADAGSTITQVYMKGGEVYAEGRTSDSAADAGGIVGILSGTLTRSAAYLVTVEAKNQTTGAYQNYAGGHVGYLNGTGVIDNTGFKCNSSICCDDIVVDASYHAGGVVGGCSAGGIIKGMTVQGETVTAHDNNAGGIVGMIFAAADKAAKVSGCTVLVKSGTSATKYQLVTASNAAGGIVGRIYGGTVESCKSQAMVKVTEYGAGGVVGAIFVNNPDNTYSNVLVNKCLSSAVCEVDPGGRTDVYWTAGGVVARVYPRNADAVIFNCIFAPVSKGDTESAQLISPNGRLGGILGNLYNEDTSLTGEVYVENCWAYCNKMEAENDSASGIGGIVSYCNYHKFHMGACVVPMPYNNIYIGGVKLDGNNLSKYTTTHSIIGTLGTKITTENSIHHIYGRWYVSDYLSYNNYNRIKYYGHSSKVGESVEGYDMFKPNATENVTYYSTVSAETATPPAPSFTKFHDFVYYPDAGAPRIDLPTWCTATQCNWTETITLHPGESDHLCLVPDIGLL